MTALAGIHDASSPPSDRDLDALARAAGATATWARGPVALAWAGAPVSPLATADGRGWLLVHGHLWDLDPAGLVARLAAEGDGALARLRGDFVLVRHDERTGTTTLVRDHLGGRSLTWHRHGTRLRFATEARDVVGLLPRRPAPDLAAVAHWLVPSGMPGDRTLFEGVHRLLPAHRLDVSDGPPRTSRYWTPVYGPLLDGDRAELAAGLREVLSDATRRRTPSTPPAAVLLSGGLDSSSVAAVANEQAAGRPRAAYSATFPDHPTVDESELIEQLCGAFDLASTRVVVRSGSVVAGALEYLDRWHVPPASPNLFFWLPLLRRAAADGVVALLDGEGGDEVFGLSPYLLADRLARGRVRQAAELVRRVPGGGPQLARSTIRRYLREFGVKGLVPAGVHDAARRLRGPSAYAPAWVRPEVARAFVDTDPAGAWKRLDGPLWWAFLVDATTRGMGSTLTHDHVRRRQGMCGIEARHPLVDVDVLEYMLRVPPEVAFDPRYSRPLLRDAMGGRLPDEVRLRPRKSNFDAVFHESLAGPDLAVARSLLDPRTALVGEYADLDRVQDDLLDAPPPAGERQRWAIDLWRLVTMECWLRQGTGSLEAALAGVRLADAELTIACGPRSSGAR